MNVGPADNINYISGIFPPHTGRTIRPAQWLSVLLILKFYPLAQAWRRKFEADSSSCINHFLQLNHQMGPLTLNYPWCLDFSPCGGLMAEGNAAGKLLLYKLYFLGIFSDRMNHLTRPIVWYQFFFLFFVVVLLCLLLSFGAFLPCVGSLLNCMASVRRGTVFSRILLSEGKSIHQFLSVPSPSHVWFSSNLFNTYPYIPWSNLVTD